MTLRNRAAQLAWPRRWCLAAAGLWRSPTCPAAAITVRPLIVPIYASPTSGCSTCGARAVPPSPPRAHRASHPRRSRPSRPRRPTRTSPRAPPSGGARVPSAARPSSARRAPRSGRPRVDVYSPTQRNSAKPPRPAGTASPGPRPTLQGPNTGQGGTPSTWNPNDPDARPAGRAASSDHPASAPGWRPGSSRTSPARAPTSCSIPTRPIAPGAISCCTTAPRPPGNYDEIDREHRKLLGYDGCGYHFVIGNGNGSGDGQIEVAQRWNNQKQGVHCRNARTHDVDEYGIGICLVGDLDKQPPTPRQVAATQALVAYLSQRYRIDTDPCHTHAHLAATPTVCPGKFFPATLLAGAKGRGRGLAEGWRRFECGLRIADSN